MEYKLYWEIPNRVLVAKVSGDVVLDELKRFNADIVHHIDQGIAPVHLISVGDNLHHIPTNLMQIRSAVGYIQHPKVGWTIIIKEKANHFTEFVVSVVADATGMKMRQVKTVIHAVETLKKLDLSLLDDPTAVAQASK